jgi:hypothetical protein
VRKKRVRPANAHGSGSETSGMRCSDARVV